jgi:hypothetical protein
MIDHQDQTFYQQLEGGIRYVDLRSCWNGTTWRTFHFELGNTVQGGHCLRVCSSAEQRLLSAALGHSQVPRAKPDRGRCG